ncbi:PREDICTED: uncharacterized protein LOC104821392 isoform X2 [Tarenaya hassleriana]|uniref:uncharacterized protein LOC104821392 isoform X1 n=1 Tax=Tarenaya hassleriana TaxID=28532 RepID=UPI00053C9907|nr:PREDICTED: uncharacterized protein LOC104821392 isoform X1 [Tarenaya hassleriana]XP_010550555.1 PREDICTED: uncharacterized protein LOC104821392 isoform X2 [Tarenaya hassleriana]
MACATPTRAPNSLQLRLALSSGTRQRSHAVYLRPSRFRRKSDFGILKVACVSQKREAETWNGSDSPPGDLAGWSDSGDGGKSSPEPLKKSWIQGVVGAGVAGVVLVAGLSYAATSLSNRNTSRPKQEMQPLTTQQETTLLSADENVNDDDCEENDVKYEDRETENKTDVDQPFSPTEGDEATGETKTTLGAEFSSFDGVDNTTDGTDVTGSISSQDKLETDMIHLESDPQTFASELEFSETVAALESSSEANITSSESSNPVDSEKLTSDNPDGLLNTEPTKMSGPEELDTKQEEPTLSFSSDVTAYVTTQTETISISVDSQSGSTSDPQVVPLSNMETAFSTITEEFPEVNRTPEDMVERSTSSMEAAYVSSDQLNTSSPFENNESRPPSEIPSRGVAYSPAGIPAPSVAIQVHPGKILVPASVDQVQCQALAALQVLRVIETDAQASDLCTRREYARWLVSASSALSRNSASKVYPAMYIENVTELAFDDISPEDPDFSSIQGLAEAGLIASKLSDNDLLNDVKGPFIFSPESPLSRQDLISWKMALEKRQLPEADKKVLYKLSGFIDIDKINPDAWPALIEDLSSGEQGIAALAFGCTRLFQPDKPITKAQAAIALANGEAADTVNEELARIEAESMAENAVSAHNALVAEVEKDVNASFEKELSMEREKIEAVEKMAEQARLELEQLRAQREEENTRLLKERAVIDSEMELISRLRRELEEQLQDVMSNKAEISFEKERLSKLSKEAEDENQRISRLQYELEVERKALSMARSWAEDEAKRAREQAKALEEARQRWESKGVRVIVDENLQEKGRTDEEQGMWLKVGERVSVEETENRAKTLVEKLRKMAEETVGKSREVIGLLIEKIQALVTAMKESMARAGERASEMREAAIVRAKEGAEELQKGTAQMGTAVKRMAEDCRDGVGKITQKFKTT